MNKILLMSDVCIQENVNIDKNLLKIIQEEVEFSICNLEGYFSINKNLGDSLGISLKNFKKFSEQMKIKAVSVANNHINDGGNELRENTFRKLNDLNIKYFGTQKKPYLKFSMDKKNIIIFSSVWRLTGWNLKDLNVFWFQFKSLGQEIKKYSLENSFIIWFPHWGIDLEIIPHPWQVKAAKEIIEEGVSVVYGHHSHIIQPIFSYKNKPIVFCGGNFIMSDNVITSYYPINAFKGLSLLLDIKTGNIETIKTYYDKEKNKIHFIERKLFKQEKLIFNNEKKYFKYFKKKRSKILLPIYGCNNIKNYINSIYSLAVIKLFSLKVILNIWKILKGTKYNEK